MKKRPLLGRIRVSNGRTRSCRPSGGPTRLWTRIVDLFGTGWMTTAALKEEAGGSLPNQFQ